MIMEMNCENFKNVLVATKVLKKVLGRNLTDIELEEMIQVGFEQFCEKRGINEKKIAIINQMRDFINKYAETPHIMPAYRFSTDTMEFISELERNFGLHVCYGHMEKGNTESLEDDINNMEGFTAESNEDEFKIALKELLDKYKIFVNKPCKCGECTCNHEKIKDDVDVLVDRLKEGEELEVSEELQNQIVDRLYETSDNFSVKIINGKMALKEC